MALPLMPDDRAGQTSVLLIVAVLAIAANAEAIRRWPGPRRAAALSAVVAAVGAAALLGVEAASIPMVLLGPLQEGGSATNVEHLRAMGLHAGAPVGVLLERLGDGTPDLRDAVRLNLAATVVAVCLAPTALAVVAGSWRAGTLLGLAFAANRLTFLSATSEVPGAMLSALAFLAVGPVALATRCGGAARALGLAALAALAALQGAIRIDVGAIGGVVLAAALVGPVLPAGVTAGGERLVAWVGEARRRPARALAVLALAAVLAIPVDRLARPLGQLRWALGGLWPLHPTTFELPLVATAWLPVGVVALTVVGGLAGIRHPWAAVGLPLAVVVVQRTEMIAGHGVPFEWQRYATMTLGPTFLVAALGWRAVAAWAGDRARRVGLGLVALTALPPLWPDAPRVHVDGGRHHALDVRAWPLHTEQQVAARFVHAVADRYPGCALVVPFTQLPTGPERGRRPWRYLRLLGREATEVASPEAAPDACVIVVHELDCNLAESDGCAAHVGPAALGTTTVRPTPYNDPGEWGAYRPRVVLAAYPLRGVP
jgi:hypothetical protein